MNQPVTPPQNDVAGPQARHKTTQVMVGNVAVGGGAPIVVQSMTNTDTADVAGTVAQIAALSRAGSEMVRITVDRDEAAAAVPHIRDELRKRGITTPLIGDFHYIGHKLLAEHPACAEALDKYRINPGNVGFKNKRDSQFTDIVEMALKYGKTVRIGANWGSLDQELLTKLMDENALLAEPKDVRAVTREAMVQSALLSAARAEEIGLPKNRMILSAKVSAVQDLIAVYQTLAERSNYAIHLGLTEAGMGSKGIVASSAAIARWKFRSRRNCCRPWASAPSCRWSRHARAAAGPPRPRSRNWRAASRISSGLKCPAGRPAIPASNRSTSRSWAASSTAPANPSMPISAYPCPAPAKPRRRRCSSTARNSAPCAAPTSPPSSRRW